MRQFLRNPKAVLLSVFSAMVAMGVLVSPAHAANDWAPMATISATTTLVTNSLCYTDGLDLVCNGTGPTIVAAASPTNVPAFRVNRNGVDQTVSNGVHTKIMFTTKELDSLSNFDTTNSRFQPAVAGNYVFTATTYCGVSSSACYVYIYKNGVAANESGGQGSDMNPGVTGIIPMNGTTDYVEAYVYNASNNVIGGSKVYTSFSGSLVASGNGLVSGTNSLSGLLDVSSAAPSNGQVLTYNSTSSKWEATAASGGASGDRIVSGTAGAGVYVSSSGLITISATRISINNQRNSVYFGNKSGALDNTNAEYNLAIGPSSMASNTDGRYNIAIGANTLAWQTNGYNNIAIGEAALQYSDGGYRNIAIGRGALTNLSSFNNTGIGDNALTTRSTSDNTAVGTEALSTGATGAYATAIGSNAGRYNSGNYSTSVGYYAGRGASGGSNGGYSTFIGALTGNAITTGVSNTLIGYNVGAGITTGSNNLIIGTNISPYSNTGSNQLNIAGAIFGDTGSGSGMNNKIGINATSPTAALEVSGTVSATRFVGDGSLLTGIAGGGGGGATDRISTTGVASGAQLGAVVASRGTVSFTLGGTAGAAYLHPTLGLVAPGVSTTGNISASTLLSQGRATFKGGMLFNGGTGFVDNTIYSGGTSAGAANVSFGFFAAGLGSQSASDGPYFFARGNNFSGNTSQQGSMIFSAGDAANGGNIMFLTGSDQLRMLVNRDGYVGIGTSTPQVPLHVIGIGIFDSTNFVSEYGNTNPDGVTISGKGTAPNMGSVQWGDGTGWKLNFGTGISNVFTPRITFVDTGRIGVGTTTPTTPLEVVGTISASALVINGVSITGSGGGGGSGTTTFAGLTDVSVSLPSGNIYGPGSLNGAIAGYGANTAYGVNSMSSTLLAGNSNSAFGYDAMRSIRGGAVNTAIGQGALRSLTSGSNNTALGGESLWSVTSGSYNTAVGRYALNGNTSEYNTAIGGQALRNKVTGDGNVAMGYYSSYGGGSSMANNTTIGTYSGQSLAGNNNTLIGYNAGAGITSGANNLLLGANTSPVASSGSNQLNIANAIFGDFGSGLSYANKIGINVASPTTALQVSGTITATQFVGDGSLLTGIAGGGGTPDSIISGTTYVKASNNTSISLVTNNVERMLIGTNGIAINGQPQSSSVLSVFGRIYVSGSLALRDDRLNTYVGATAGSYSTSSNSGSLNAALGYSALANNTGDYNTAVGSNAGSTSSGSSGLTLVGQGAGSATTASGTTAIGAYAQYKNGAGVANTSVGYQSLMYATYSSYNTVMGYAAGLGVDLNSVYSGNTLYGAYTGTALTTGNSNTIIGANSGMTLTTGSRNILIGANITPLAVTGTGQLSIGNAIFGDIGSALNNNNKIGINVASPTVALQVSGTISTTALTVNGVAITGGGGGGTPGGATTQVQYNDAGAFAGSSLFTWNNVSRTLVLGSSATASSIYMGGTGATIGGNSNSGTLALGADNSISVWATNQASLSSAGNTTVAGYSNIIFQTNANVERMRILTNGNIGMGVTTPSVTLHVSGSIVSTPISSSGTSFNWANGNVQYTSASCGAMTFTNMLDGGAYTLVVKGATSGTCSFTHSGLTVHMPTDHAATTASKHTIYTFLRAGSDLYVSWINGM